MKFVFFYHAFSSCWNNGHAHFLRGVTRELALLGHEVTVVEEANGWSRQNAIADCGEAILAEASMLVPGVRVKLSGEQHLEQVLSGADVVLVHEWNEPALVAAIGRCRKLGGRFQLFFHDTHHRAVTAPQELDRFALDDYDAVLVFGEVLREIYCKRGWAGRAFTWHEAADVALFHPKPDIEKECDLVWIGNWGDDERTAELSEFLIEPASTLALRAEIHGVRYPEAALRLIADHGFGYRGWLPNHCAPDAFARAHMTVHVPRGPYVRALPGIPTIRVFEALACGIPLVSAPWDDVDRLFPPDAFVKVRSGGQMKDAMRMVLHEPDYASRLAAAGPEAIHARHTTRHRAEELVSIVERNAKPRIADIPAFDRVAS